MNTTQTNTLAAAAQEAGRRALAAIRSGEPPTYFVNRMTLFKEMQMQQTVDAAKFLYGVFSGFEINVGHLIAGLHKESPKVRELEAILDNQLPAILETNSKKVAVFQIGELGVLSPISFWADEISKADDLKIGINSPGGDAGIARQLVETITAKSTSTCTVTNRAYSAAALLVQCFTHRRIAASGKLMFHGPRMFSYGSPEQVTADAVRVRSEVDFWIGLVETRTGLPRPTIANWLSSEKDYYFTAKEALDLGLVDEIIPDAPAPDPTAKNESTAPLPHPDDPVEALARTILGRLKSTFQDKARYRAIVEEFAVR